MNAEQFIEQHTRLHEQKRQISIEKEERIRAINDAMRDRIKEAKNWAERERQQVMDEAHQRMNAVRAELTRLHYEFHDAPVSEVQG